MFVKKSSNILNKHLKLLWTRLPCSKLSYIHNLGREPLRALTIGKLLETSARKYDDRPAIVSRSQNETLSFQQVLDRADRLAAGLRTIGINADDRVGIWAPNITEWYITHMACARGGFVLVNINPAYQPQELQSCVNSVGVKAIVCPDKFKYQNYYENLLEIAPVISKSEPGKIRAEAMPSLESIIVCSNDAYKGAFNYQDILKRPSDRETKYIQSIQNHIDPDSTCHLQFTSGTTGKPKAAMQSHFHLVNNSYFIGKRNELNRKRHIICMQVPFFHVFGTVITVGAALNHGATLVLPTAGYDPDKALDAIRDENCSIIHGTPTMYVDLVNRQKLRNEDIHPQIAVSGGASISPHLFKEMKKVLNLKKTKSVYGLTETTAVVFQSLCDDDDYQSTSTVGYPGDHVEVKVVDEKGNIVPRGTPGELCIRGYPTILGYWQNEEKTKELIGADKWLRTGDQFVLEETGYGRMVGRIKDMINRGGENIFPAEIESYLNTHPAVIETHVVGIPHERLGEEVCACIRVQSNSSFTLDELKRYCGGKMSHFKIPSRLHIVESFPKTASGKIQKHKLVELIINK